MRIPILRRGNDPTPIAWWEWLFAPVVYGVILCLFLLLVVLSFPYAMIVLTYQFFRERRFSQKLFERGRFVPWEQLEPRLLSGEGTLVIEQAQKDGHRVWWTQDDVERKAPTPPPPEEQLDYLRFMRHTRLCHGALNAIFILMQAKHRSLRHTLFVSLRVH